MKIVIVGGAGFIGSYFTEMMIKRGHDILVYDKLTYASVFDRHPMFKGISPDLKRGKFRGGRFVWIDICGFETLLDELEIDKPDVVVNFAAESHVDRSIADPFPFVHSNVVGTLHLLECCRRLGLRYVHISTDEVYGTIESGSWDESASLHPRSPYAASKAAAEHFVMSYVTTHGLNASITRSSNNFGPFQHVEKFLPHIVHNVLRGEKVPIYGTGTNVRDWLYIGDNCAAIEAVMTSGKPGDVYNIGGDHELTNIEFVTLVLQKLGKDPSDFIEFVEDRKGHDQRYSIDCSKIKKELGWSHKIGFDLGLELALEHYCHELA